MRFQGKRETVDVRPGVLGAGGAGDEGNNRADMLRRRKRAEKSNRLIEQDKDRRSVDSAVDS